MAYKKYSLLFILLLAGSHNIYGYVPLFHLLEICGKIGTFHGDIAEKIFNADKKHNAPTLKVDPTSVRLTKDSRNSEGKKDEKKEEEKVLFSDVIGIKEIMLDIKEVVEYVKNPQKYKDLGAKPYKGILLEGPPGSGKTMIAKAIAAEAGCHIEYASASSFVEMYVGVGAQRVRELFNNARKKKPTIVFIDELDAIGAVSRGAGANEEYRQTLNELLCQMDGFKGEEGIIVIGATNHAKALDSALKRAGRFDRIITIPLPNADTRLEMMQQARTKLPSASISDDYLAQLAKDTYGLTASDINNIFNEAALLAVRESAKVVEEKHMIIAAKKIIGERRK